MSSSFIPIIYRCRRQDAYEGNEPVATLAGGPARRKMVNNIRDKSC